MRLTVIGCGHLGATHAACMAEIGHEVLGVDTDDGKIQLLREGRTWFAEPGLEEMLAGNVAGGRLRFTTSFAEASAFAAESTRCSPTPSAWIGGSAAPA